jgi:hypothetical protein
MADRKRDRPAHRGAKNGRQAAENAERSFRLTADEVDALNRATIAWRS